MKHIGAVNLESHHPRWMPQTWGCQGKRLSLIRNDKFWSDTQQEKNADFFKICCGRGKPVLTQVHREQGMTWSPVGGQSWCQLEPKWHVITIVFSKSQCCKGSPGVTHLHRPWTKSWSTWQINRQESWLTSNCCCSNEIKKRNRKIISRREDRE